MLFAILQMEYYPRGVIDHTLFCGAAHRQFQHCSIPYRFALLVFHKQIIVLYALVDDRDFYKHHIHISELIGFYFYMTFKPLLLKSTHMYV